VEDEMAEAFNPTEWITTKEAAELTGYTARYLRKAIARGRLQGIRRGRDWFLKRDEVLSYAEEMRRLGPAKHDPWRTGARKRAVDAN
jgi:excisionase family DNA binding protein